MRPSGHLGCRACGIVLGVGLLLAGCGGDGSKSSAPPPSGPSGPFTGGYVDSAGFGGVLTFTISGAAAASPASAMLAAAVGVTGAVQSPGGGTVPLTGTYDASTIQLQDASSGYAFAGTLQGDGHFAGIAITQAGSGSWSAQPGNTSSVEALCGSYSRCLDVGCALPVYLYPLSLVVAGGSVSMATFGLASGEATVGTGTATASSVSFDFDSVHADGDLSPGSASGTWSDGGGSGESGIWSASAIQCPLAGR